MHQTKHKPNPKTKTIPKLSKHKITIVLDKIILRVHSREREREGEGGWVWAWVGVGVGEGERE